MDRVRFEPTFNLGQLLNLVPFVVSIMGIIWWQSQFQSTTEARLTAAEQARAQWVPVITDLVTLQAVSTSQDTNINTVLNQLQATNEKQVEAISSIRERLAKIEGKIP